MIRASLTACSTAASCAASCARRAAFSTLGSGRRDLLSRPSSLGLAAGVLDITKQDLLERVSRAIGGGAANDDSINGAIAQLEAYRSAIVRQPQGPAGRRARYDAVDAVLVPLLDIRAALTPPTEAGPVRNIFDLVITDISEADYPPLARSFRVSRLARADPSSEGVFPVTGVVYGRSHRVFMPLPVRALRGDLHWVFFLVAPAAPRTFLRADTMDALGFTDSIPDIANVFINGVRKDVQLSQEHFDKVDLLGADFLNTCGADLRINYDERIASLTQIRWGIANAEVSGSPQSMA